MKLISKQVPITKIGTNEQELKYALFLQSAGTVSTKTIAEFACKHTSMQPTMVKAMLESCFQIIEYHLSLGHSVRMGDLGTFYPTLSYKAVDSNTEAGLAQLKKVNVRFRPNSDMIDTINKAEKELLGIYKLVDHVNKYYKEVGTAKLDDDNSSGTDSGTPPNDQGGGGTSQGGNTEGGGDLEG